MGSSYESFQANFARLDSITILVAPEIEVAQDLDAFYTWFVEPVT